MLTHVTDSRSNAHDQIAHAARELRNSPIRRRVFAAVYRGKSPTKTVDQIAAAEGLTRKQVLDAGHALAGNHLVGQSKKGGVTAYTKDDFYSTNKGKILRYADNPRSLARLPTKTNPSVRVHLKTATITVPAAAVDASLITIDDIDSFAKVRAPSRNHTPVIDIPSMAEADVKEGFRRIIGAGSTQRDWGGEKNDFYTTRVRISGKRVAAAFAFKGRATRGPLTPRKLGKNGDQLQRLFRTAATLFVLQHVGEISESVVDLMAELAKARSVGNGRVLYCVVDGLDTERLAKAYPQQFAVPRRGSTTSAGGHQASRSPAVASGPRTRRRAGRAGSGDNSGKKANKQAGGRPTRGRRG